MTAERSPADQKLLKDALNIAYSVTEMYEDTPDADQAPSRTLAKAFLILAGDIAALMSDVEKRTHFCGWCAKASGGFAHVTSAPMTLDEVREHTVRCEANPLVREVREAFEAGARTPVHTDWERHFDAWQAQRGGR